MSLEIDKCKSKIRPRHLRYWLYLVGALKGIFDLPYCQSNTINVLNIVQISGCSVKRINNISLLTSEKDTIKFLS